MELNEENVNLIQSACNPVAVANQLAKWSQEVSRKDGLAAVRDNPLLKAVVGKLCSLYGIDHNGMSAYGGLGGE